MGMIARNTPRRRTVGWNRHWSRGNTRSMHILGRSAMRASGVDCENIANTLDIAGLTQPCATAMLNFAL
jgi:hypothetical protein